MHAIRRHGEINSSCWPIHENSKEYTLRFIAIQMTLQYMIVKRKGNNNTVEGIGVDLLHFCDDRRPTIVNSIMEEVQNSLRCAQRQLTADFCRRGATLAEVQNSLRDN